MPAVSIHQLNTVLNGSWPKHLKTTALLLIFTNGKFVLHVSFLLFHFISKNEVGLAILVSTEPEIRMLLKLFSFQNCDKFTYQPFVGSLSRFVGEIITKRANIRAISLGYWLNALFKVCDRRFAVGESKITEGITEVSVNFTCVWYELAHWRPNCGRKRHFLLPLISMWPSKRRKCSVLGLNLH